MKNKAYLSILTLTLITTSCGTVLSGTRASALDASDTALASVEVGVACTLSGAAYDGSFVVNGGSTTTTESLTSEEKASMVASCNDTNGFYVAAKGSSSTVTIDGTDYTNYLVGTNGYNIGVDSSNGKSYWAMKLTSANTTSGTNSIATDYNNTYGIIPNSEITLITVTPSTNMTATSTLRTDYKVFVSSTQAAGTYTGSVTYTLYNLGNPV